ncbi:MAG: hypothetical protein AAF614_31445 [Chloroflexota bacterium]
MTARTLQDVVQEKPFTDFAEWWPVGTDFLTFMSNAIHAEWVALPNHSGSLAQIADYTDQYLQTVFQRAARPILVDHFVNRTFNQTIYSGEFDALSYAFFRDTFEKITDHSDAYSDSVARERRLFTKRVGRKFYDQVHTHLALDLPSELQTGAQFSKLKVAIGQVGLFMANQGYLRDHFGFHFDVNFDHAGRAIRQTDSSFLQHLENGTGFALYEMGYPIILPSAVYLYHTIGEAQHHSSRTIEELFDRVGYEARETDDFDPIGFPSEMVVELWEIQAKA